ncbi:DUF393 domain-containing protein [Leptobacterium flavescens]|uniref:DUF393 domain-containing protein n=1 Tax=Leptobacterium flavescens TaxID=472055 RepID=A0A6P0UNJ0_9FLAO|nr:DUF393 domain-containing protein [Leptobacterium flavescens]NER14951.1 DUF393 domain-containing protein [Leptobacterium flavescens]
MQTTQSQNIIIYDGICNLCNGVVGWVFKNTSRDQFEFVPFQSRKGQELLALNNFPTHRLDTVILFEGDSMYTHSDGFLRIMSKMRKWKTLAGILSLVPRSFRDGIYTIASRNRIKWFGSSVAMCTVNLSSED